MKQTIQKFSVLIFSIFYLVLLFGCEQEQQEIRLRILASSNDTIDQQIKLEVKEYVQLYLTHQEVQDIDLTSFEAELNQHFKGSHITVQYTLSDYEAKSYQGKMIQAGRYPTLLITIGEGKGKNFWTLLYPEFFNISFEDDHEVEYRSYFYDLFTQK
ncbi:MAG: stage II sporulation protein R [Prevotella sp.]|nr:stage II sporulation protein R [Staphylococcus sp.]MCM1350334.1 stage II sporulation protein R [Prevotella sp.]